MIDIKAVQFTSEAQYTMIKLCYIMKNSVIDHKYRDLIAVNFAQLYRLYGGPTFWNVINEIKAEFRYNSPLYNYLEDILECTAKNL